MQGKLICLIPISKRSETHAENDSTLAEFSAMMSKYNESMRYALDESGRRKS